MFFVDHGFGYSGYFDAVQDLILLSLTRPFQVKAAILFSIRHHSSDVNEEKQGMIGNFLSKLLLWQHFCSIANTEKEFSQQESRLTATATPVPGFL